MAHLTGIQNNTREEEGNMGRKVKVSELRKGMRVASERGGWRYELTVFKVETPEQGGVSSWTVYADNNGSLGELHCYHGSTEFEVLEEAPVPPEPGVGSTVLVGDETLFSRVDDDYIGWRGANEGGYTSWRDLNELGEVEVLFDIASTKPKPKPKLKVGDQLATMPEDGSKYEGYVFHVRYSRNGYMVYANGSWGWSFGLDKAKSGRVSPYTRSICELNAAYAPLTVVSVPEGK